MAMTKAEMQEHWSAYHARLWHARAAVKAGDYEQAVKQGVRAFPFIDGMMQFERKYEAEEFESVEAIDIVLELAPLLLHHASLGALEHLLRTQKRIDKNTDDDLASRLSKARSRMSKAHQLLDCVERNARCRLDDLASILGGKQETWRALADSWERMGLLRMRQDGGATYLTLATRLNESTQAKCPSCGAVARAPKTAFLVDVRCPKCRSLVSFVLQAANTVDLG